MAVSASACSAVHCRSAIAGTPIFRAGVISDRGLLLEPGFAIEPSQTARLLGSYEINDISVEDPPIEDTISHMFTHADQTKEQDSPDMDRSDG